VFSIIRGAAPIRLCDQGGWTDTWFAQHGCVFNLAAQPAVEVELRLCPADPAESVDPSGPSGATRVVIHAENFGAPYARDPGKPTWDQQPLIEAALESLPPASAPRDARSPHDDWAWHVNVFSTVPPGASVGSSASTAVALLAALQHLHERPTDPDALAADAHRLETDRLGQQSGVQDALCAAYGGACFIEIDQYPHARVTRLPLPDALRWELNTRLALVYLGRAHDSSAMHERVIQDLAGRGPDAPPLQALRRAAIATRDAFLAGDLRAFGEAMQANTAAQAALHAGLVGPDAQRVIAIARAHGAMGWKVNGAGGDGGSLTILGGPSLGTHRAMLRAIEAEDATFRTIPIRLSPEGVRAWRGC
jgi:D-glycero-alpha-D-manno-heptose-7-phosphate kinase